MVFFAAALLSDPLVTHGTQEKWGSSRSSPLSQLLNPASHCPRLRDTWADSVSCLSFLPCMWQMSSQPVCLLESAAACYGDHLREGCSSVISGWLAVHGPVFGP